LLALKTRGLVEKVGISVYEPTEIAAAREAIDLDIVQAPFSVFDRRMLSSGWLDMLAATGVEIHVRSVFLQGLLLMPNQERPSYFSRWNGLWAAWHAWLSEVGLTPLQVCLRYAASFPEISKIVVGVDRCSQLTQVLDALDGPAPAVPPSLQATDPDLLNPTRWKFA
jgi:aryl-alcohol dehydrogenase-like predicted oxidoreductase